jgi:oligopeptide/dipeptide ABC transporter ATP-binding protein
MNDLQQEFNLSYLFIAHDLAVVKHISDRIAIMYLGRIAESGEGQEIYKNPLHPYTRSLMSAIPVPDPHRKIKRQIISGDVPSPIDPPSGCTFHPRCPEMIDECKNMVPSLETITQGHKASCHLIAKA